MLTSGHVMLVASYAACSILRVLTQWGATLVIISEISEVWALGRLLPPGVPP